MTRRQPDSEKRAAGSFRKDRERPAPTPLEAELLPPMNLSEAVAKVWRRRAPALCAAGLLTPLDTESFAMWCALQASVEASLAVGATPGRDVLASHRALSAAFGMTPDARSKLGIETARQPQRKTGSVYDDL